MDEQGVASRDELEVALGREEIRRRIVEPNILQANEFARDLRRQQKVEFVVTPGPLTVPGWNQPQYHRFWEGLVRTRVSTAYFNDGWEYSNGCTYEFVVAVESNIPTFDATGDPLDLERGVELIARAIRQLEDRGFEADLLHGRLKSLSGHLSQRN